MTFIAFITIIFIIPIIIVAIKHDDMIAYSSWAIVALEYQTPPNLADFPAVFFHICHGTQQAVVTPI